MGMNELHSIEVVLTYMEGLPVMLIKSAPTNDYDSGAEANAWVNRVTTGSRCRAIAMTPINGAGAPEAERDAAITPERTCPMDDCILGPGHDLQHQDRAGETWDELDLMGERVVNSGSPS